MKKKLEVIVLPKPHKRKEFRQSMYNLSENLQKHCSSLLIDESGDGNEFIISARWDSTDQMRQAVRSKEFIILCGAINALCESTVIRLNDKQVGNHISKMTEL